MTLLLNYDQARDLIKDASIVEGPFEGGQKYVFKCQGVKGFYACKIICPSLSDHQNCTKEEFEEVWANIKQRSLREYNIMKKCKCNNLVQVHEGSFIEERIDDINVIIFHEDWIEGTSLNNIMRIGKRGFSSDYIISLALDIINAIEVLDCNGFIHRDIKPSNIIRRESDGIFVLLDLGIALDQHDEYLTRTGYAVGTVAYCAPEQINTRYKADLNFKTDLFSLGTVMYELSTGVKPYYKPGYDVRKLYNAIMNGPEPARPSDINPEIKNALSDVIMRLLSKSPNARYRKIEYLRRELKDIGGQR